MRNTIAAIVALVWAGAASAQVANNFQQSPLSVVQGYTYTYAATTGVCTTNDPNGCTNNMSTALTSGGSASTNYTALASFNTEAQRHERPTETGYAGGANGAGNPYTSASKNNCAVLNIPAGSYDFSSASDANASLIATKFLPCFRIIGAGGSPPYSTTIRNLSAQGGVYGEQEWQTNGDFFESPLNGAGAQLGYFIQNAAQGATSVTLTNSANASNFYVGRWVFIGGYEQQFLGLVSNTASFPPNYRYYDWAIVTAINGGVISLGYPASLGTYPGLQCSGASNCGYTGLATGFSNTSVTWPHYGTLTDGPTGTIGPARITPADTPAYPVTVSGYISGIHFGTNPNWTLGAQVTSDGLEVAGCIDCQVNDISSDNAVTMAEVRNFIRSHSQWAFDEADKDVGYLHYRSDFVGNLSICSTATTGTATFTGGGSANITMPSTIPLGCPVTFTAATTLPAGLPIQGGSGTTSSQVWVTSQAGTTAQVSLSPYSSSPLTFSTSGTGTQTLHEQNMDAGTYNHAGEQYWQTTGGRLTNQFGTGGEMTIGAQQVLLQGGAILNGYSTNPTTTFNGAPNLNDNWPNGGGLALNGVSFIGTSGGNNAPALAAPFATGANVNTNGGYLTVDNGITISSGTYNSGTGAVVLTLASTPAPFTGATTGLSVDLTNLTGTGAFASINGSYAVTAGSSGTTLNLTAATGLGTTTITGGQVSFILACTGSGTPSCASGPNGSGTRLQITKFDANSSCTSNCGGVGTFGSPAQNVNDNWQVGMQQWVTSAFVAGCFVTNITSDNLHIFVDFTSGCTMTTGNHVWVSKTSGLTVNNSNFINIGGTTPYLCTSGSGIAYNGSSAAASFPNSTAANFCNNNIGN